MLHLPGSKAFSASPIRARSCESCFIQRGNSETSLNIYLFAEFDPRVELSRIYLIFSGTSALAPMIQPYTGWASELVGRAYNRIGSAIALLLAMKSLLLKEGQ